MTMMIVMLAMTTMLAKTVTMTTVVVMATIWNVCDDDAVHDDRKKMEFG